MSGIADLAEPPYYAVIFTSLRRDDDPEEYAAAAADMMALAATQPGFIGVESARDAQGLGITVSYWRSLDDIAAWREQADHRAVQRLGRDRWYGAYAIRIARVERQSGFERPEA